MAESTKRRKIRGTRVETKVLKHGPNVVDGRTSPGQRGSLGGDEAHTHHDVMVVNARRNDEFVAGSLSQGQGEPFPWGRGPGEGRRRDVTLEAGFGSTTKLGRCRGTSGANVTTLRNGEVGGLGHRSRLAS